MHIFHLKRLASWPYHRNLKFCPITDNNHNIKNTPIYYKKTQGMKRIFPGQTQSTSNASNKQRPISISRLISINNTIMNTINNLLNLLTPLK